MPGWRSTPHAPILRPGDGCGMSNGERKKEKRRGQTHQNKKKKKKKKQGERSKSGCSTGTSQEVTHPSAILAQRSLTSDGIRCSSLGLTTSQV